MSHMHIPDGVLPAWIVVAGWLIAGAGLALALGSLPSRADRRPALLGVMSALMLVAMSLELVPIAYHVNLTVLTGIVIGPALGFVAAFVVNLMLAFFGHGGITVVGLNTLTTGLETVLGFYFFRLLGPPLSRRGRVGLAGALATVLALATGTGLMIGIVAASNVNPGIATPQAAAIEPGNLSFRNPFSGGVLTWEVLPGAHDAAAAPPVGLATFVELVLALGAIGWTIEAFITAIVVRYVALVRPDLVRRRSSA